MKQPKVKLRVANKSDIARLTAQPLFAANPEAALPLPPWSRASCAWWLDRPFPFNVYIQKYIYFDHEACRVSGHCAK